MMSPPVIAFAIGDPNGIGPEIAVKAAAALAAQGGPRLLLVGDRSVIAHYAARLAPDLPLKDGDGTAADAHALNVVPSMPCRPGPSGPAR